MDAPIVRLVRMTFQPDRVDDFLQLFNRVAGYIRSSPGCLSLELLGDEDDACVFTTYSLWTSSRDLEQYRMSPLFEETWRITRQMFAQSPEAVSYRVVRSSDEINQLAGSPGDT